MGKGVIRITPSTLQAVIDKKSIGTALLCKNDNNINDVLYCQPSVIKEALLLPDGYIVHEVRQDDFTKLNDFAEIIVSSEEIPEVDEGKVLPRVDPIYALDLIDGKYVTSLKEIRIGQ